MRILILEVGQQVRDAKYGLGVVTGANEQYTTIKFDEFGLKKYVTSLMHMETVAAGEAKPPKSPRARTTRARRKSKSA